jgi:hypothetical protein
MGRNAKQPAAADLTPKSSQKFYQRANPVRLEGGHSEAVGRLAHLLDAGRCES